MASCLSGSRCFLGCLGSPMCSFWVAACVTVAVSQSLQSWLLLGVESHAPFASVLAQPLEQ